MPLDEISERAMYYLRLVGVLGFGAGVAGCDAEPLVCPDEFVAIPAVVVNSTGETFATVVVRDTVLRTETVLDITAEHPSGALPADGNSAAVIFSDAFQHAVRPTGDEVAVAVTAGDHSATARYEFGTDGCHVEKLKGPDTLTLE